MHRLFQDRDTIQWRLFAEENSVMSNPRLFFALSLSLSLSLSPPLFLSYNRTYKFEGYDGAQNRRHAVGGSALSASAVLSDMHSIMLVKGNAIIRQTHKIRLQEAERLKMERNILRFFSPLYE